MYTLTTLVLALQYGLAAEIPQRIEEPESLPLVTTLQTKAEPCVEREVQGVCIILEANGTEVVFFMVYGTPKRISIRNIHGEYMSWEVEDTSP
jgi:hypothetical protein